MLDDKAQGARIARIRHAAESVLADSVFQRSPVLSRLLTYLVDMTAQGAPLKSYTIAVDALGKTVDDLDDPDTYAGVAVARLRKALTSHYAAHPADEEIFIDSGSYTVQIRDVPALQGRAEGKVTPSSGLPARLVKHLRHFRWRYAAGCLVVISALAVFLLLDKRQDQRIWTADNFPTVAIVPERSGPAKNQAEQDLSNYRLALRDVLQSYYGFRLVDATEAATDYEIRLQVNRAAGKRIESLSLVEAQSERLVWSDRYEISSAQNIEQVAIAAAAEIGGPGGALHSFARGQHIETQSPYGCWLRFTASIQTYKTIGDDELHNCAAKWYAVAEEHPIAAFLRSWTLANEGMTKLNPASRLANLNEALDVVHRASALNPDSAMLYLTEMRTYSFLGDQNLVRQSAMNALTKAAGNRVVKGMAASWLVFWNIPDGADLLQTLEDEEGPPYPWECAGRFVVAMMRDDVPQAGRMLAHLRTYMSGQPLLLLFEAAYAGRTGNRKEAQQALDALRPFPRGLAVSPEDIIERLPAAPEVKTELAHWIFYKGPQNG